MADLPPHPHVHRQSSDPEKLRMGKLAQIEQKIQTETKIKIGLEQMRKLAVDKSARKRAEQMIEIAEKNLKAFYAEQKQLESDHGKKKDDGSKDIVADGSSTSNNTNNNNTNATTTADEQVNIVPEAGARIKHASRKLLEKQLAIEEKVLTGAENILRAYSTKAMESEMKAEAEMMVQDAKNKITFIKMELLRQSIQDKNRLSPTHVDLSYAARRANLKKKLEVEIRIATASAKLLEAAKMAKDKKLMTEAKTRLDESTQKSKLLTLALSRLPAEEEKTSEPLTPSSSSILSEGMEETTPAIAITGRLLVHIDNAEGFYYEGGWNDKYTPYVVVKIGNKVSAQTSNWTQTFTFPHWNEDLSLNFTNEKEIEFLCYADKDSLIAYQSLKTQEFIDAEKHKIRLALEPQGMLNVILQFENTLIANKPVQSKGLRRQQDLFKARHVAGKKLIRPADLGVDIAAWIRLLRGGENMRQNSIISIGFNQQKQDFPSIPEESSESEITASSSLNQSSNDATSPLKQQQQQQQHQIQQPPPATPSPHLDVSPLSPIILPSPPATPTVAKELPQLSTPSQATPTPAPAPTTTTTTPTPIHHTTTTTTTTTTTPGRHPTPPTPAQDRKKETQMLKQTSDAFLFVDDENFKPSDTPSRTPFVTTTTAAKATPTPTTPQQQQPQQQQPQASSSSTVPISPARMTTVSSSLTMADFKLIAVLGRGHFGKVFLAQHNKTKEMLAVKCLKKSEVLHRDELDSIAVEKSVFLTVSANKHPFLVNLHASFQTASHLCFVMEFTHGGDLLGHIQRQVFDERRGCFYAACVTLGLKYLHDNGIIYRDLKLDNLLVDREGYVKIADFGLCKTGMALDKRTSTFCGTPEFIAPEVLTASSYSYVIDWWGLGVLIYEMLVGEAPFPGDNEEAIFEAIVHDEPDYPYFLSITATAIIRKLLQKNPRKRLGYTTDSIEIMNNVFFRGLSWEKLLAKELKPPYVPKVTANADLTFFDKDFTSAKTTLTPPPKAISSEDQERFKAFSFTADWLARVDTEI